LRFAIGGRPTFLVLGSESDTCLGAHPGTLERAVFSELFNQREPTATNRWRLAGHHVMRNYNSY